MSDRLGMSAAVAAVGVGRRYGNFWALRDCTLSLPTGSVTAVVGPNGAGKTTLLSMLVGLLPTSAGELTVVGRAPGTHPDFLARVGFVAQDCPLYKDLSVADHLRMGRRFNPRWDDALARERLAAADVPLDRRAGRLSGGQRAQVALALALAKRPDLLLLDEPLASLDPLARREFLKTLMASTVASGVTVVLSSHLIGELARVCDHLVAICDGRLRLLGELDQLLDEHRWVSGPAGWDERLPGSAEVISQRDEEHSRLLVRTAQPLLDPALVAEPVNLEDLVLAYLEAPRPPAPALSLTPGGAR